MDECPEPGDQLNLEEVETESRVSGFWSLNSQDNDGTTA